MNIHKRLKLYKSLLWCLMEYKDRSNAATKGCGYCGSLNIINCTSLTGVGWWCEDELRDHLPELYAIKPKKCYEFMKGYWWSPDNFNIRIKKLINIIKQMEDELQKHKRIAIPEKDKVD